MLLTQDSRRLRIAVVGCGSHAYRSIFPCFDYLPVELIATCDLDLARARQFAARFGARAAYGAIDPLLASGDIEAVVLVVGPKQHPDLTCAALAAGLHVWMEKPPSMDAAGAKRMMEARESSGKNVVVGFKKVFMPGMVRMKAFLESGKFGRVRSIAARFPIDVPPEGPEVLAEGRFTNWLGNGVHPLSALVYLGGRPQSLVVQRSPLGGGFLIVEYPGGAVGCLHLAEGHSASGPMERYEVVCEKGHLVLENNVRLLVYRPGYPFDYRHGSDFAVGEEDAAALIYEPQHTLSTLENKAIFLQGFVQELQHFVDACLQDRPPTRGTLDFALTVMECYEAGLKSQGKMVKVGE